MRIVKPLVFAFGLVAALLGNAPSALEVSVVDVVAAAGLPASSMGTPEATAQTWSVPSLGNAETFCASAEKATAFV